VSKGRSEAVARTNTAAAERARTVEFVSAEANRFNDLLPEYRKDKQLFTSLRYAEALQRIFTNVQEKIILQERADGKPRELRLQLNREPPKPKTIAPEPAHEDKH
jgi:hypothetical protein